MAISTTWIIDPTHSEVQFKVKHLVISTVTGSFKTFEGQIITESDDFDGAKISFLADTSSIDTNQEQRDVHLKSAEFFDVEKYPKMTFANGILIKTGEATFNLKGDLTIKDVTKPFELKAEYGGNMTDFYGNHKSGFELTGKVNRKEFGLTWSAVTEAGGIVVSDEVKLNANIQVVKQ